MKASSCEERQEFPPVASCVTSIDARIPLSFTTIRDGGTCGGKPSGVSSEVLKLRRLRLLMPMSGAARPERSQER